MDIIAVYVGLVFSAYIMCSFKLCNVKYAWSLLFIWSAELSHLSCPCPQATDAAVVFQSSEDTT